MYMCVHVSEYSRERDGEREGNKTVCLFVLYGISTFVGYLMTNPFFIQMNSSISSNSVEH